ncbi:xanthine dehydrogenase family protein molybdopterin-binding subunit [Parachryseolinea silvisoli]|uniref:xanthine dehydrogenase family protein molybdopterin-binding subunit n=1 Tax=Parachryseolinea silvisoli TaxID=2873601 RepID=UPI0022657FF7|nr:molybdopterin cofactor-binding domain-containing protein [Parachryseolinea silvisoli]MCD9017341.1 molybdopterin-dependent oxidoreductase [Parachryseolinea silvisoli]
MLAESPKTNRRDFIKTSGLATLGLLIGLDAKANLLNLSSDNAAALPVEINPFILIGADNTITIINPRPCMGQGTIQSVPAMIAEELEVDMENVTIIQSDGKSKYGAQTSGNSSSIRRLWLPLRKAGAATKEMLIEAASGKWSIAPTQCYAENAKVFRKDNGQSFTYGELVEAASKLSVPQEPVLKQKNEFKILGKPAKRFDLDDRVTGKAVYGLDIDVPGMVYAAILHSPMIFGKLVSIDDSEVIKIPGVIKTIPCERTMIYTTTDSVAVIASNWWAASKGRSALKVAWDKNGLDTTLDNKEYMSRCYTAAKKDGIRFEEFNDFQSKFETSQSKLDLTYETPFLSHVPIEPETATAHVKEDGSVEIWAPLQGPGETLEEIARYLNISTEKVKIHVALMGGSFGRKAYMDFIKEACFLSNKLKIPVKVIWTRDDDIRQGPYRPALLSHMQGFVEDGKIKGFHHHMIGESILGQVFKGLADDKADPWIGEESSPNNNKYIFTEAHKVSWTNVKTVIPIMWWRSVNASNIGWGQECFIDELAHLAGKDPLQARLDILEDERFRKVLATLAEKTNYHQKLPQGSGRGIAITRAFGTIVACCITATKSGNGVKLDSVVSVIDCGIYVNADTVKAQTEGNIIMGITAAIKPGIVFNKGVCAQNNYNNYPILRINETPKIEVYIIENAEAPGGVGEAGLPPVAPALGNAIFATTGIRKRNLPIDITNLTA